MRKLAVGSLALLGVSVASLDAAASNGLDSPEAGAYQVGRGGAWLARADDPLAVYFNPAGLVRQASGVHLGAHLMFMNRCFTRQGQDADQTSATYGQYGFPVSPGQELPGPGATTQGKEVAPAAASCAKTEPFPNPQIAANFRVHEQLAVGLGIIGPHGVGATEFPDGVPYTNQFGDASTQPSPQRFMLVKSSSSIFFPTLSVSYAVNEQLSLGAGFTWGIAIAQFENFSEATSPGPTPGNVCGPAKNQPCVAGDDYVAGNEVRAKLSATDLFIPGFVVGALWSPSRNIDVAGWFRWSDAVDTDASVNIEAIYWAPNGTRDTEPCKGLPDQECKLTKGEKEGDPGYNAGHIKLNIPMEAKLGVRFHYPRQNPGPRPKWAQGAKSVRDAMSEDLFDIEMNFTYANNSVNRNLEVRFQPGIVIKGAGGGTLPVNADIPHGWKDVFGVRLGGELSILPSFLSARAGFFYESRGQDPRYLNVDFHNGEKVGLSLGGSVRLGPVDLTAAFQHTFFGTLDNGGRGALYGLSGDAKTESSPGPGGPYRTYQAVNGGKLESELNEVALGGTVRF